MDRYTLYMMEATLLIFFGISVFLSRRTYRLKSPDASTAWFAIGYVAGGVGMALQSMRDGLPPVVGILLSNCLFMLLTPFMHRAFGIATRQSTRFSFPALLTLNFATMVSFFYLTFVHPNVVLRSLEAGIVLIIMVVANAILLLRSQDQVIRRATRLIAGLQLFQAVSSILRTSMVAHKHAEWFSVGSLISLCGVPVAFMWIDALRLSDELEQRAMIDPLTSIFNRRALDQVAERLLDRSRRANQPCSALMLDIDQFKQINDSMGHVTGDATLCAVAEAFGTCLRRYDIAMRFGGDEFFILLPDSDEAAATVVADRIRKAVRQLTLKAVSGQSFNISTSIGKCTLRGDRLTIDEMLHASDISLYSEKQSRQKK